MSCLPCHLSYLSFHGSWKCSRSLWFPTPHLIQQCGFVIFLKEKLALWSELLRGTWGKQQNWPRWLVQNDHNMLCTHKRAHSQKEQTPRTSVHLGNSRIVTRSGSGSTHPSSGHCPWPEPHSWQLAPWFCWSAYRNCVRLWRQLRCLRLPDSVPMEVQDMCNTYLLGI